MQQQQRGGAISAERPNNGVQKTVFGPEHTTRMCHNYRYGTFVCHQAVWVLPGPRRNTGEAHICGSGMVVANNYVSLGVHTLDNRA